jgi:hypothetical protein
MIGRWNTRVPLGLGLALGAFIAAVLAFSGAGPTTSARAIQGVGTEARRLPADDSVRQVTVFTILATPDPKAIDPSLDAIKNQLAKVLPDHGFKLLEVKSKRIGPGGSVTCDLGNGYKARTELVRSFDENGKIHLRCELTCNGTKEFSTLVKTPVNQLFLYERTLQQGRRVLVGVGAREHITQAQEYGRLP